MAEKYELKEVTSLKDLQMDGPEVTLDLTEDAWEFGAPPPLGAYQLKCVGLKFSASDTKDANKFMIKANIEARVVNNGNVDYNDYPAFINVSTFVGRGKSNSTMAGLLDIMGAGKYIKERVTAKALAELLEKVMKQEPIIIGEGDWRGSYKFVNKKGEDEWKNVYNHYWEFPDDGEGGKKHILTINGVQGPVEIRAQFNVNKFFKKGQALPDYKKIMEEMSKGVKNNGGVVSQPTLAQPVSIAPTLVSAPKSYQQETVSVSLPTVGQGGNSDVELMLD